MREEKPCADGRRCGSKQWFGSATFLVIVLSAPICDGAKPAAASAEKGQVEGTVSARLEEPGPGLLDIVLELRHRAFPTGLGVAVTFDGRSLRFLKTIHARMDGLVGAPEAAETDARDVDGDPSTGRLLRLAWFDPRGAWTPLPNERHLARLRFETVPGGVPSVAVVPLSHERAHRFLCLRLAGTVFEEAPDDLPRTWPVQASGDPTASRQQTGLGAVLPCSPDADGNGSLDALTDGVLIMRHLAGYTGAALVNGALGQGASRTTGQDVASFLSHSDCLSMLDVDANGSRDVATDGRIIARWLFGFRDQALVDGVLGSGAQRQGPDDISSYLAFYSAPREAVIQASLNPGEYAQDVFGQVQVTPVDGSASVTVIAGTNDEGGAMFEFGAAPAMELEVILTPPGPLERLATASGFGSARPDLQGYYTWGATTSKWFAGVLHNRLPESKQSGPVRIPNCLSNPHFFGLWELRRASRLRSACSETNPSCWNGRDPVLFIHGYSQGGALGDAAETFERFPQRIMGAGPYVPFLFDWNTAARFEDVAADLGAAIVAITARTGKKVHLVAHSFGGVLARTLLQGLGSSDQSAVAGMVRTLITLGSPHSGIADGSIPDDIKCLHGTGLPPGQGSWLFEGCQQLSCHEMGEDVLSVCQAQFFDVDQQEGGLAARLAGTVDQLPTPTGESSLDVLALIGWKLDTASWMPFNLLDRGDGLITYHGQRFLPSLTVIGTCPNVGLLLPPSPLLVGAPLGGARVTEKGLGIADPRPGEATPFHCDYFVPIWMDCDSWQAGYAHAGSDSVRGATTVLEAGVACDEPGCHHGYDETLTWISQRPAGEATGAATFPVTVGAGDALAGTLLAGVTVWISDSSGFVLAQGVTQGDGTVAVSSPFRANATFSCRLWKSGYQAAMLFFSTGLFPELKDLGTKCLYPAGTGSLTGRVTDLVSGVALAGVSYSIRHLDHSKEDASGQTDSAGQYLVAVLASGTYETIWTRSGFEGLRLEIVVPPGSTPTVGDVALTPVQPQQVLTVGKSGAGSGTVTSSPVGINCGSACSAPFAFNTQVTLTAQASGGSTFSGWSGEGCTGSGTCQVTMSLARNVMASFSIQAVPGGRYACDEGGGTTLTNALAGGQDGTITGATYVAGRPGAGTALRFAGGSDRVVLPLALFSGFGTTAYFEAWIKPTSYPAAASSATIFRRRAHYRDWWIVLQPDGSLETLLYGSPFQPTSYALATGGHVALGAWTKVASFYDGSVLRLLVNDVQVASDAKVLAPDWSASQYLSTEIGNVADVNAPFVGDVDDVVISMSQVIHSLTVTIAGSGAGTVASAPSGVSCGSTCTTSVADGSILVLTAQAAGGSSFDGWSGEGCSGTGTCQVTMTQARSVTATFSSAGTVLVDEPFSGSTLPPGFTVLGGSASVSGGRLTLSSGCLQLPGSYSRASGLRIEADVVITNGGNGDFNYWALYDTLGPCQNGPNSNGYYVGTYPAGSDNPVDLLHRIVGGVFLTLGTAPTRIGTNQTARVALEMGATGELKVVIDGVVAISAVDATHSSGKLCLRSWGTVYVDNLLLLSGLPSPTAPHVSGSLRGR